MADSLILMVMALVVFGPRRLPQIGRQIGKLMYEFRKASNDFKFQMEEELRNAEEADRRKQEEERLRALAAAAPAQPALTDGVAPVAEASAAVPDGQFPVPSPYPGEALYPVSASAEPLEAVAEATVLQVQPPTTGEQVAAARPGSLAAQVEAPAPPARTAESEAVAMAEIEPPAAELDAAPAQATEIQEQASEEQARPEPVNQNG